MLPRSVAGLRVQSKATWKKAFKLPWREAGPPNHHDDQVDSGQQVVNKELSLYGPYHAIVMEAVDHFSKGTCDVGQLFDEFELP